MRVAQRVDHARGAPHPTAARDTINIHFTGQFLALISFMGQFLSPASPIIPRNKDYVLLYQYNRFLINFVNQPAVGRPLCRTTIEQFFSIRYIKRNVAEPEAQ